MYIYTRKHYSKQALYAQHTHTPKESSTELPTTGEESSNIVALPGFNHNAEATTHVETSRNEHNKETLSTSLKTDTNMDANMDTIHMAH